MSSTALQDPAIELATRSNSRIDTNEASLLDHRNATDDSTPDGGYGWVVVFACSVIGFWFVGITYSWGIVQAYLVQENIGSASTLAFVGSLTVGFMSFMALISARLVRQYGTRNVALVGISLLGIGETISSWSTSIPLLFFTVGIVMGLGCALCFMSISTLPAQYFKRKRGLANGLVFAGGGLGGTIISLSNDALLAKFGLAWTFRTMGLLCLATGIPSALLLKERVKRTAPLIDWTLFQDMKFVLLLIAGAIATFPLFVPPFFLPLYGSNLGFSKGTSAALLAGFNLSSAFGRIGFGFAGDILGPINSLFLTLLVSGLSMLSLWPLSTSLGPLVAFVLICGMANGGFFAIMPTVVGRSST